MGEAKTEGSNGNGTTTAPVYLRLQQRAQAESRRAAPTREQARMRSLSLGFLVLLFSTCVLWIIVNFVDTDPRFRLHHIELSGSKFVAPAAVESVFVTDREVSIYRIPLEERRRELERIPWVRTATITRLLPDRVAVAVEERQPVAFLWTRHGIELMDGDGVILDSPPEVSWTFPVLRGIPERESPGQRKTRMESYLRLMEGLRVAGVGDAAEISEVDLSDPANLTAVVADKAGALRLHLGNEDLPQRYEIYRTHIAEWRQQFNEIRSIDLRFEGQAVIQSASPYTVSVESHTSSRPSPATGAALPAPRHPTADSRTTRSAL
jgi:cell division protein FtsQ